MAVRRRLSVVGNSGSGKTSLARRIGEQLGIRHVELDAIFHQPGWTPLPKDEFRSRVEAVWDPQRSILRWAWTRHHVYRQRYTAEMRDPRWSDLDFVRLRSIEDADRWLSDL